MHSAIPPKPTASKTSDPGSGTGDAPDCDEDSSVADVTALYIGNHEAGRAKVFGASLGEAPEGDALGAAELAKTKRKVDIVRQMQVDHRAPIFPKEDREAIWIGISPTKMKCLPSRPLAVKVMSVTELVTEFQMKFVSKNSTVGPGLNPPMALTEPRVKFP